MTALRFSPRLSRFWRRSARTWARLWSVTGGRRDCCQGTAGRSVGSTSSRDGHRAVLGGQDGKLRLYTLDGSRPPQVLEGHRQAITLCAFSPDGDRILSMSETGTRLWRESGAYEVLISEDEDADEHGVALRRGHFGQLVTQRRDGLRLIWDLELDPQRLLDRLWQATPFCLSPADRQRYLRESPTSRSAPNKPAAPGPKPQGRGTPEGLAAVAGLALPRPNERPMIEIFIKQHRNALVNAIYRFKVWGRINV